MSIPSAICARREANARLPISWLSDDILTHIFSLNITTQADFALQHCTRRSRLHTLETYPTSTYFDEARQSIRHSSQVCYHWRFVAFSYDYLWSDMDLRRCSSEWADVLWRRSGNAPVTMWLDSGSGVAELEDKHIPRLQELHAWIYSSSANDVWQKILAHPNVIITQMKILDIKCLSESKGSLKIPDSLKIGSQQPSLTTLLLRSCTTNLRSPLFSNLTLLSVQVNGFSLSVHEWLEILLGMPKLVKLDLGKAIMDPHKHGHDEPQIEVELRCLQSLTIWEPINGGMALFVKIIPPSSCLLDISLSGSWSLNENVAVDNVVFKRYSEKFAHDINSGFSRSLKIETFPRRVHFNNQNDYDLLYGAHRRKPGFDYLDLQNVTFDQPLISLLSALDNDLSSVTTLSLGLHEAHPDTIPYLHKFTSVTTLNLLPPGQLPDMIENVLFPSLRVIRCSWMSLTETFYKTIVSMVQWRRAHCNNVTAIERICILRKEKQMKSHHSFSADEIQSLDELGVRVESVLVDEPIN